MGKHINTYVEIFDPISNSWKERFDPAFAETKHIAFQQVGTFDSIRPFMWRNYCMFGFLADYCNYHDIPSLTGLRGLPKDIDPRIRLMYNLDVSFLDSSWLLLSELIDFDYDQTFEDRREITGHDDFGVCYSNKIVPVGQGIQKTIRDVLGERFFQNLEQLKKLGDPDKVRIIIWFD
jgi:hypothetical protein